MNLEQIEEIIAKNLTITDQRLMDGVIGAVMDAVAAEREACAGICDRLERRYGGSPELEHWAQGFKKGACVSAAKIRARGQE